MEKRLDRAKQLKLAGVKAKNSIYCEFRKSLESAKSVGNEDRKRERGKEGE